MQSIDHPQDLTGRSLLVRERQVLAYSVEKLEIQRKPNFSQSAIFSKVRFNPFM